MTTIFGSGQDGKQYLVGLLSDHRQEDFETFDAFMSPLCNLIYLCCPELTESELIRYFQYLGLDVVEHWDDLSRYVTGWVALGYITLSELNHPSLFSAEAPIYWEMLWSNTDQEHSLASREEAKILRSLL